MCFLFPYSFIVHQINLLDMHKKCVVLNLSCNLLLVCLLQSSHKRDMGVYKVFNSYDLMLLFYSVYLCFILDLRRKQQTQLWIFQIIIAVFYYIYQTDNFSFIIPKRLYHTSFQLNF